MRLGINIDHVATLRNARGGNHPDPLKIAIIAEECKVDNITAHLREDRRHVNENDIKKLLSKLKIPLNFEMAATSEMVDFAIENLPFACCIVPEKRQEITTEGGLNLKFKQAFLRRIIKKLKENNSRVSLFIEPSLKDVKEAKFLNADCIEIHTGKFCKLVNEKKSHKEELMRIKRAVLLGVNLGLEVHAGHGLTFKSAKILSKVQGIKEFNIGHFLIGESIFSGLAKTIKDFKKIIKK